MSKNYAETDCQPLLFVTKLGIALVEYYIVPECVRLVSADWAKAVHCIETKLQ
ncbi:hypothetical protein ACZ87_02418 [Candidatus Erwinia dacicola]|uniref:Uncharacterized protein n=1 Tax=Candidatus Erwinia dacicola TaxID=252393 RepID=A0A328TJH8_9GAMM|nr:hypothetical protein ACZ87_02418 [Candidatus Erwinia dacicola]